MRGIYVYNIFSRNGKTPFSGSYVLCHIRKHLLYNDVRHTYGSMHAF